MTKAENQKSTKTSDFKYGKEIGHGSFSTVMLAKEISTNKQYAAKIINKIFISKQRMVNTVLIEKEVLRRINHPFCVCLNYTFQDPERLYFIISYAERGELLSHLTRLSCFDLTCTQFYSAEIILALEYLHGINVVHRDIKPENILLSANMHIKICDFGSAIITDRPDLKPSSFTGTAQFVSPEMLGFTKESKSSTNSDEQVSDSEDPAESETKRSSSPDNINGREILYLMDFWALGCIVYQMLSGRMPFHVRHSRHEYEIFQKIRNLKYEFPDGFDDTAKDFVKKLLILNPLERLGNPSSGKHEALKRHPLFESIDFLSIGSQTPPLLVPNIEPIVHSNWDEIPVGFEAAWKFNIKKEFQEMEKADKQKLLQNQEKLNPFHRFVKNRLIIKQGILYKRRGLFTRKRMFLLTEGPHLFYVDPDAMQLKKEVDLALITGIEVKNEKVFYIITKKRTYFLEDPSAKADDWRQSIENICQENYGSFKSFPGTSSTQTCVTALPES